jgi:hypothetical protein
VDHTIRTTTYVAAVFIASLIGVGMNAAQAGSPTLTFKNSGKLKISVKVDKIGYRNDIDTGRSDTVPASKLQNVDPKDQSIVWEAYPADLKSVQQKKPNPKCDGGTIKFDNKGTANIEVKGTC